MGERRTAPSLDHKCLSARALLQEIEVKGMKLVDKDEICAVHNARIRHIMACTRCHDHWLKTGGPEVTSSNLIYPGQEQ